MNRWALTIAAGPTYVGCAQNDGHDDVHARAQDALGGVVVAARARRRTGAARAPARASR